MSTRDLFHGPGLLLLTLGLMLLFPGCSATDDPDDPPVARAYEQQLLWSHLRQMVPLGSTPEDSAALAQGFIRNWLRQQTILHKAERNLGPIQGDIESQLRDYHNSLVIFAYEQALVEQKLDTVVDPAEIEAYHTRNAANFELKDNILRIRWFKLREDDRKTLKRLEDHFLSKSDERMGEVEHWLAERGIPIIDRSGTWTNSAELRNEVPILFSGSGPEGPKLGRSVLRDSGTTWFVDILEHRSKESAAPLELVQQDIRSIIINQRKLQLIERMREDLYLEALEQKDIEVL